MSLQVIKLKTEIIQNVKSGFLEIIKSNPDIYAFALYSDENCETLLLVANTLEYLEKTKKEYGEDELDHSSKFSPDEWDFTITNKVNDKFNPLCKELSNQFLKYNFENQKDEIEFDKFQVSFYNMCIDILKELKEEDFFKNNFDKDLFLLFSASEFEFTQAEEKEMIISLNDNKYADEYVEWMKSWTVE